MKMDNKSGVLAGVLLGILLMMAWPRIQKAVSELIPPPAVAPAVAKK